MGKEEELLAGSSGKASHREDFITFLPVTGGIYSQVGEE